MIKFKNLFIVIIALSLFNSCTNKSKSLDYYFVTSENKDNFLLLDLSPNLLALSTENIADIKEIFKPIKKINLLALKKTETNKKQFKEEFNKVLTILKQSKYQDLTRVKDKKLNMQVKYVGNDNNIKEVVVLLKEGKMGFLIGRILGDNLKVENVMKMVNELPKLQNLDLELKKIQDFIK